MLDHVSNKFMLLSGTNIWVAFLSELFFRNITQPFASLSMSSVAGNDRDTMKRSLFPSSLCTSLNWQQSLGQRHASDIKIVTSLSPAKNNEDLASQNCQTSVSEYPKNPWRFCPTYGRLLSRYHLISWRHLRSVTPALSCFILSRRLLDMNALSGYLKVTDPYCPSPLS